MASLTLTEFIYERLTHTKLNNRLKSIKDFINLQCVHTDEVSNVPVAGKLLKLDNNSMLPTDITGSADKARRYVGEVSIQDIFEEDGATAKKASKAKQSEDGHRPGFIHEYGGMYPPDGWLECNGQELSRIEYSDLFAAIGTFWGDGDKVSTYNIPDFRGEFVRGWDHGRGIDPNRILGSFQEDSFKLHNHPYRRPIDYDEVNTGTGGSRGVRSAWVNANTDNVGGTETRPRNKAVMYIIKY